MLYVTVCPHLEQRLLFHLEATMCGRHFNLVLLTNEYLG